MGAAVQLRTWRRSRQNAASARAAATFDDRGKSRHATSARQSRAGGQLRADRGCSDPSAPGEHDSR